MVTRTFRLALAAFLGTTLACASPVTTRQTDAGRLGRVLVFRAGDGQRGFVFLFSDASGWTPAMDGAATALARDGAVVAGVDLARYLRGLAGSDDGCHYVIAELEDMSERLQRDLRFARYRTPILAGAGAGGTLAYAALAQTPAATMAGAASVDPAPSLGTKVPLCEGAPARSAPGGGFAYGPASLPGWWRVSAPATPALRELVAGAKGTLVERTPSLDAPAELVALLRPALEEARAAGGVGDLPLTEYPVDRHGPLMAVIYSGDGGWRDLDKEIGEVLAQDDVPVVGVDSLRYFWNEKTPEEVARDLAETVRSYAGRWGTPKVVLIGYSFGAAILPFAVNRLPQDVRAMVVQVSLLGLESRASFQIRLTAWFGATPGAEAPAVLPELLRLDLARVQCFYGEDEEDTLCRAPEVSGAEIVRTSGGHHFDEDYPALAQKILDGARRRLAAAHLDRTPRNPPDTSAATLASTRGTTSPPGQTR